LKHRIIANAPPISRENLSDPLRVLAPEHLRPHPQVSHPRGCRAGTPSQWSVAAWLPPGPWGGHVATHEVLGWPSGQPFYPSCHSPSTQVDSDSADRLIGGNCGCAAVGGWVGEVVMGFQPSRLGSWVASMWCDLVFSPYSALVF
jgi:hypothetical protein